MKSWKLHYYAKNPQGPGFVTLCRTETYGVGVLTVDVWKVTCKRCLKLLEKEAEREVQRQVP